MTTPTQADDAICAAFKTAWEDAGEDVSRVEWPNVAPSGEPLSGGREAWCRVTIKLDGAGQRGFAEVGQRRFERYGLACFQVFVPAGERGLEESRRLAMVPVNAFEGKQPVDGVSFGRVEPKDVGPDGPWLQTNVWVSFGYDEVK